MFEIAAPPHVDGLETVKTCHISFVSAASAMSFCRKYGKNLSSLRALQERLKNSSHLRVSLNELRHDHAASGHTQGGLAKQDFFKLKTLNYINEFNATRAVLIKFELAAWDLVSSAKEEIRSLCSKYGEIEDFKVSKNEAKCELKFLIHFTSIDSAIKIYEYHIKLMQNEKEKSFDQENKYSPQLLCKYINFHRDRCDRPEPPRSRQSSTVTKLSSFSSVSSLASSPVPSRRRSFNSLFPLVSEATELDLSSTSNGLDTHSIGHEDFNETDKGETLEYTAASDLNSNLGHKALDEFGPNDYAESVSSTSGETARSTSRVRRPAAKSDSFLFSQNSQYPMSYPIQQTPHSFQYNPDPYNIGNRTLYLGNLHPNTQAEEIANNVRAGGLVESLKYYKSKRICFITFIDPVVAQNFYVNHQVLHQLIIHGSEVNVGWGNNYSGPLNRDISLAVTAGASRNVFIGIKLASSQESDKEVIPLPNESKLRSDFSKFGDLEQINFYHNNDCGFMNFMNITDAIKVVELFENSNVDQINQIAGDNGEFYQRYKRYKISFGKDRCGNPPKFNYKKKLSPIDTREIIPPQLRSASTSREDVNPINEETALVFGISTEDSGERQTTFNSTLDGHNDEGAFSEFDQHENNNGDKSEALPSKTEAEDLPEDQGQFCSTSGNSVFEHANEDQLDQEPPQGGNVDQDCDLSKRVTEGAAEGNDSNINILEDKQNGENESQVEDEEDDDDDGEDDEDDEDDDISIIIGSDITTSSLKPKTRRSYRKHDKIYNHRFGLNDGFSFDWNQSFNSTLSLSSTYAYPPQYHGGYGMGYPGGVYYPHEASFAPQSHHVPYYGVPQLPMQMAPMYNQGAFSTSVMGSNKGPYLTSGSLVMAQYLAKSQHQNYVYASNILNNDVTVEDVKEYKRQGKRNGRKNSTWK